MAKWKPLENALGWDLLWLHDYDFMMPTVEKGQVFSVELQVSRAGGVKPS